MLTERSSDGYSKGMKSEVRIIGGAWRGRKLPVVDAEGLRPTPDRIRETLFNWLAADCRGARVLDCFAGSGALGFEALSRGARELVLLERNRHAVDGLRTAAAKLEHPAVTIIAGDACASVARLDGRFDLVFIDPPYAEPHLRSRIVESLAGGDGLAAGARVYFEWPIDEEFTLPCADLSWYKRKSAGQVNYAIAEWRRTG